MQRFTRILTSGIASILMLIGVLLGGQRSEATTTAPIGELLYATDLPDVDGNCGVPVICE